MTPPTPQKWMHELCQGDPLSLYVPNAVLVPTYEPRPLVGRAALAGYFRQFTGSRPGLCGTINCVVRQPLGLFSVIYSGTYTFFWGRGERAEARYTFVSTTKGIVTHHSSEVP